MGIDWAAEKAEYVTGDYKSLKDFSERRSLSYSTVRKRAKGWDSDREQHRAKVGTLTEQKAAEKKAERRAALVEVKERLSLKLWQLTERAAEELESMEVIDPAQLRRVQQVYTDLLSSESGTTDSNMGEQINAARQSFRDFIEEATNRTKGG